MTELDDACSGPAAQRTAKWCAMAVLRLYRLPADFCEDLVQEGLLEIWQKQFAYDPRRGAWLTFANHVASNRIRSVVRCMHSARRSYGKLEPLGAADLTPAGDDQTGLRTDVQGVLSRLNEFDRIVAVHLIEHSALETSVRLGITRAAIYRAIGRLRLEFAAAGLRPAARCSRRVRVMPDHD